MHHERIDGWDPGLLRIPRDVLRKEIGKGGRDGRERLEMVHQIYKQEERAAREDAAELYGTSLIRQKVAASVNCTTVKRDAAVAFLSSFLRCARKICR